MRLWRKAGTILKLQGVVKQCNDPGLQSSTPRSLWNFDSFVLFQLYRLYRQLTIDH